MSASSSDGGLDVEGQRQEDGAIDQLDVALEHRWQVSASQTSCATEEPRKGHGGGGPVLSSQDSKGLLLWVLGSERQVGLLFMALSAFSFSMTGLFVKLAGKTGLSTWQILLTRTLVIGILCCLQLARSRVNPWGNR